MSAFGWSYPPGTFTPGDTHGAEARCEACGGWHDVTVVRELGLLCVVPEECPACGGRLELQ